MKQSRAAVGALGVALVFAGLVWEPRTAGAGGGGGAGGGTGGTGGSPQNGDITLPSTPTRQPDTLNRDSQHLPHWISYADCEAPVTLTFDVQNAAPAMKKVVGYWSRGNDGSDCLRKVYRTNSALCHTITASSQSKFSIKASDIVGELGIQGCGVGAANTDDIPLNFYFMVVPDPTKDVSVDYAVWLDTTIDLWGPSPPAFTNTEMVKPIKAGDEFLTVNFDSTNTDVKSYRIFHDPPPNCSSDAGVSMIKKSLLIGAGGGGGAGGAGSSSSTSGGGGAGSSSSSSSGSSGSGGGTSSSSGGAGGAAGSTSTSTSSVSSSSSGGGTCSSTWLVKGGTAPECLPPAAVDEPSSPADIKGLTNGQSYTIAIAGIDEVGNIGPLSELACGTPVPADTFWKEYCQAGGVACVPGGCGCSSVGADETLLWPALSSIGFTAMSLALIRRRRRRAARGNTEGR